MAHIFTIQCLAFRYHFRRITLEWQIYTGSKRLASISTWELDSPRLLSPAVNDLDIETIRIELWASERC
jgi:hypothetical protein